MSARTTTMEAEPRTHDLAELIAEIESIKSRLAKLESSPTTKRSHAESVEQVQLFCEKCGLTKQDGAWFWSHMLCNGWRNNGKPVRSWQHCITAWKIACIFPSQKQNGHGGSVRDLQTALTAKRSVLDDLLNKYSSETASGRKWMPSATQEIRLQALSISREIKELTARIAQSA